MRCTRVRRMYLPKVQKKDPNAHPMQVQSSQNFLRTAGMLAIVAVITSAFLAMRKVQQRNRLSERELLRKRPGQRVVIVGGGSGGAAVAAVVASAAPEVQITVIEKEKQQVFLGHVPLANVGHRSYDASTTTGIDFIRSPASWNVTRDANLVATEVLRVDPVEKKVYARTTKGMLAAATTATAADTDDSAGTVSVLWRWWPWRHTAAPVLSVNGDGSSNLADGTTVFAYDVLVVAAGAHRSLGGLEGKLRAAQLDSYRIAVNPGTTRDSLVNLFSGTVLHVKVPPASFVLQMEAAQALTTPSQTPPGSPVPSVELEVLAASALLPQPPPAAPSAASSVREGSAGWLDALATAAGVGGDNRSVLPDEVALHLRTTAEAAATAGPPAASPLMAAAPWFMRYSSRQHDSTFVSSVNTVWRCLYDYSKLGLCSYVAATADPRPIAPAPAAVNDAIEVLWREQQLACRQRSGAGDGVQEHFHVFFCTYLRSVDTVANVATLFDYKNGVEVRVPYSLLMLDLPLRAPAFVRASGLHRTRYVDECVVPALRCAAEAVAAAAAAPSSLRQHPLLRKSRRELELIFQDEASFMDVDHATLQHRRFPDIFAVGDVAGVPSVKGYGAISAQVPVVAHNVRQALATLKARTEQDSEPTSAGYAKYTGYSSFHVVMSMWRAMWPEMCYDAPQTELKNTSLSSAPADVTAAATKRELDVVAPLGHCNNHLWDSLAWRDPRGFMNGLFHQLALYEVLHFFIASRGLWHSPTWFYVPKYSTVDGAPQMPTWRDLL